MAYIEGEAHGQHTLFPSTLDDLIPHDHVCRAIEAFVGKLSMEKLGLCGRNRRKRDVRDTTRAIC